MQTLFAMKPARENEGVSFKTAVLKETVMSEP
jgi:hypothetical protein